MNVSEALRYGTKVIQDAKLWAALMPEDEVLHRARYEAESLLLCVTGWTKTKLVTSLPEALSADELAKYESFIQQRTSGTPLQYITQAAAFYGRLFSVRPGCLIPRPETEVLVESALCWLRKHRPAARTLDLGTGSGIIATTVKLECPSAEVEAIDLSPDAIQIAEQNAKHYKADIRFHRVDGLEYLRQQVTLSPASRLNLLLSNPPYIPSDDVLDLDAEVRDFEPKMALDGGVDGLDFYRAIANIGDEFFAPGPAALFYEVGVEQASDVISLYADWDGWSFEAIPDLRGIARVVFGERL